MTLRDDCARVAIARASLRLRGMGKTRIGSRRFLPAVMCISPNRLALRIYWMLSTNTRSLFLHNRDRTLYCRNMKTVVITGASRGIGKATAEHFLEAGWCVLGTATAAGGWTHERLSWIIMDLRDTRSIKAAAETILERGPIQVLINNAGYLDRSEKDFEEQIIDVDVLRKTLEVNVIGTIDFTERLLPAIERGGHIISLGSNMGSIGGAMSSDSPSYRISKAALSMYTRVLASRLRASDVTVSIVSPGWVKTDMGGAGASREPAEAAEDIFRLATSEVPTGRFWREGKELAC